MDDALATPRHRPVSMPGLGVVLAGALTVAGAVATLSDAKGARVAPRPEGAVAASTWIDVARPLPRYDLSSPMLTGLPTTFFARRHVEGGGRVDTLAFGRETGGGAYVRVALYRMGREAGAPAPFYVDLARGAGEAGFGVDKSGLASTIETRFGPVETLDATLSRAGERRACLAFRRVEGKGEPLRMAGFACGPVDAPMERVALTCLLDRLDLVAAADDAPLRAVFEASEARRGTGCPGRASGFRASWLDPTTPARRWMKR